MNTTMMMCGCCHLSGMMCCAEERAITP